MSKDKTTILDKLYLIRDSISQIRTYSASVHCPNDFLHSAEGMLRLDACVMRMQVIGESVRSLLALENSPLNSHPEIEWKQIVGMRNIISHEYMSVDEVIIFDIIKHDLDPLKNAIEDIISNLS